MGRIELLAKIAKQGDKKLVIIPSIWHNYLPKDEVCKITITWPVKTEKISHE